MALLRCDGSPGFFGSGLQLICAFGSGVCHLPLDNVPSILLGVPIRRAFLPVKHQIYVVLSCSKRKSASP